MAGIEDVKDSVFREALEQVDALLAEGAYSEAARLCGETYLELLRVRPDFVPPPPNPRNLPQFRDDLPESGSRLAGGSGRTVRTGWPNGGGLKVLYFEPGGPMLSFEKERFGLSEASSYFEFLIEEVVRAERE
jgi:hypothetical protein